MLKLEVRIVIHSSSKGLRRFCLQNKGRVGSCSIDGNGESLSSGLLKQHRQRILAAQFHISSPESDQNEAFFSVKNESYRILIVSRIWIWISVAHRQYYLSALRRTWKQSNFSLSGDAIVICKQFRLSLWLSVAAYWAQARPWFIVGFLVKIWYGNSCRV